MNKILIELSQIFYSRESYEKEIKKFYKQNKTSDEKAYFNFLDEKIKTLQKDLLSLSSARDKQVILDSINKIVVLINLCRNILKYYKKTMDDYGLWAMSFDKAESLGFYPPRKKVDLSVYKYELENPFAEYQESPSEKENETPRKEEIPDKETKCTTVYSVDDRLINLGYQIMYSFPFLKDKKSSAKIENLPSNIIWTKSDTDLLELITSLVESESIQNLTNNLTRKEAIQTISQFFNREIKDAESKLTKATNRKKDITSFINRLKISFEDYAKRKDERLDEIRG